MKSIKIFSLLLVSLLLAFSLTTDLSEAKSSHNVITYHSKTVKVEYLGPPNISQLEGGFYKLQVAEKATVESNMPKWANGSNFINPTIIGVQVAQEFVMTGTYKFEVNEKSGWIGTFHGYRTPGNQPNSVQTEIFAEGKGYGDFTGYRQSVHETEIRVNDIVKSDTADGTIYPPGK